MFKPNSGGLFGERGGRGGAPAPGPSCLEKTLDKIQGPLAPLADHGRCRELLILGPMSGQLILRSLTEETTG